ncbi:hypothetical protein HY493_03245 [Candidatus Woesearchaeota archaeon]|nr:hypothetical protein [Candidatus Woesearchaeota archaeon]
MLDDRLVSAEVFSGAYLESKHQGFFDVPDNTYTFGGSLVTFRAEEVPFGIAFYAPREHIGGLLCLTRGLYSDRTSIGNVAVELGVFVRKTLPVKIWHSFAFCGSHPHDKPDYCRQYVITAQEALAKNGFTVIPTEDQDVAGTGLPINAVELQSAIGLLQISVGRRITPKGTVTPSTRAYQFSLCEPFIQPGNEPLY